MRQYTLFVVSLFLLLPVLLSAQTSELLFNETLYVEHPEELKHLPSLSKVPPEAAEKGIELAYVCARMEQPMELLLLSYGNKESEVNEKEVNEQVQEMKQEGKKIIHSGLMTINNQTWMTITSESVEQGVSKLIRQYKTCIDGRTYALVYTRDGKATESKAETVLLLEKTLHIREKGEGPAFYK